MKKGIVYKVMGWRLDNSGSKVIKKTSSLATADDWANLDTEYWIEKYKDWDGASINDKVEGSKKPRNESDTIH